MTASPKFVLTLYVSKIDENTEWRIERLRGVLGDCLGNGDLRLSVSKHILVIDDDACVRDAFELALEPAGYQVECATDGQAGIEAAVRYLPDMVFGDLNMPGLDGLETLRRLQDCFETPPPSMLLPRLPKNMRSPCGELARKS